MEEVQQRLADGSTVRPEMGPQPSRPSTPFSPHLCLPPIPRGPFGRYPPPYGGASSYYGGYQLAGVKIPPHLIMKPVLMPQLPARYPRDPNVRWMMAPGQYPIPGPHGYNCHASQRTQQASSDLQSSLKASGDYPPPCKLPRMDLSSLPQIDCFSKNETFSPFPLLVLTENDLSLSPPASASSTKKDTEDVLALAVQYGLARIGNVKPREEKKEIAGMEGAPANNTEAGVSSMVDPPVKRSRGRPCKDPAAPPKPPSVSSHETPKVPKKRGRPPKNAKAVVAETPPHVVRMDEHDYGQGINSTRSVQAILTATRKRASSPRSAARAPVAQMTAEERAVHREEVLKKMRGSTVMMNMEPPGVETVLKEEKSEKKTDGKEEELKNVQEQEDKTVPTSRGVKTGEKNEGETRLVEADKTDEMMHEVDHQDEVKEEEKKESDQAPQEKDAISIKIENHQELHHDESVHNPNPIPSLQLDPLQAGFGFQPECEPACTTPLPPHSPRPGCPAPHPVPPPPPPSPAKEEEERRRRVIRRVLSEVSLRPDSQLRKVIAEMMEIHVDEVNYLVANERRSVKGPAHAKLTSKEQVAVDIKIVKEE